MVEGLQSKIYNQGNLQCMTENKKPDPLYLTATVDPGAHITLSGHINSMKAELLIDSGATGVFMHPDFAQRCQAVVRLKSVPREVRVIDGRLINSGLITHEATVELVVADHKEILLVDLTNTGRYSCILGTPWLVRHDPTILWSTKQVNFNSPYCETNCKKWSVKEQA